MIDAHDEAAKAVDDKYYDEALSLLDAWWRKGGNAYELTPEDVATALRKAAADERESCAKLAETHIGYHPQGVVHSVANAIRARAKGGATSVPASGIHERAEGHPKSCTCSYCEVGR